MVNIFFLMVNVFKDDEVSTLSANSDGIPLDLFCLDDLFKILRVTERMISYGIPTINSDEFPKEIGL